MQNNNSKESQENFQDIHLYVLPNGFIGGIQEQDLINSKISYYGGMYTKEIPKDWFHDKK